MTFQTPTWQKTEMICSCGCGSKFKPNYRNGILVSKLAPNCRLKQLHKQVESKGVRFASELPVKRNTTEKKQKTSRQKWMDKADTIFSQYIRVKHSFQSGGELFCHDIITGKIYGIKFIDNGHCFSRKFKSTRFEEDNCRPQNRSSNRFSGEADHYKFIKNLKSEIGTERFERLEELKESVGDDSETFYHLMYDTYKFLLKELLNERRIENPWKRKK